MLFSATFPDHVKENINKLVQNYQKFEIKKEALKLKGVKQYRIRVDEQLKI